MVVEDRVESSKNEPVAVLTGDRGKVNEIDFCMAPSDVSLSRSYGQTASDAKRLVSLTRALNNASNRAVRRILLSRSWPSAEALNMSLRLILANSKKASSSPLDEDDEDDDSANTVTVEARSDDLEDDEDGPKCPVPRPILNILMRRRNDKNILPLENKLEEISPTKVVVSKRKTDEEWVSDQMANYSSNYGAVPGYSLAEAYLESVLCLATSGVESPRVADVLAAGVYDEAYKRIVSVLQSAGVQFVPLDEDYDGSYRRKKIAPKLIDQDICLSILDKITISREQKEGQLQSLAALTTIPASEPEEKQNAVEDLGTKDSTSNSLLSMLRKKDNTSTIKAEQDVAKTGSTDIEPQTDKPIIKKEDLGGVLLSAKEPSMTRQLNVLSNVVQRTLLFGGDQELLVLYETLEADRPAFIKRWYPGTDTTSELKSEDRSGVQYFNAILQLLKDCYSLGVITDLSPAYGLNQSYANAFERLTASLVELGSGYVRPITKRATLPKTPKEELGRFVEWERRFRQQRPVEMNPYPEDLVGDWFVRDEVQGKTIGVSTVTFAPEGVVEVAEPLRGLRWRLDPGPTHLDTCTFQVLGEDGAVLQYRGFVDRGARLEARFSKRSIKIRGEVRFQMRDGEMMYMGDDYRRDMLPLSYKTGSTRFVMSKATNSGSKDSEMSNTFDNTFDNTP